MDAAPLLLTHAAATLAMAGVIWFVQLVHYPLFDAARRDGDEFAAFERRHQRRTTWVVAPLMLVEGATAVALVFAPPSAEATPWTWAGLAALALIWISTVTLQVPAHRRLARGWDSRAHRRLVRTNWIRTALWTGRAALALGLLGGAPS